MEYNSSLYLVPTPIGNLQDITLRALEVLKYVDIILAEDTRTTGVLLKHYQISKPLKSYHIFNEHKTIAQLIGKFQSGRAKVKVNGLYGIIDIDGKEVVPPKYEVIQPFKDNRARVSANQLWGIIDMNGKEIVPVKYEKIGLFQNRKAHIREDGKWGIISWDGKVITAPKYDKIISIDRGFAKVMSNSYWGISATFPLKLREDSSPFNS